MLIKAVNHQVPGFNEAEEGQCPRPYFFVHGADPQLGFIDLIKGGGGKKWDEEVKLLKQTVEKINKMEPRPKFFFICGDLVDAFPGVEPTNTEQTEDFLQIINKCQVPTLVISGNHDIGNQPTNTSIDLHRKRYGDDYYCFHVGGVFYIALNSQYFYQPDATPEAAKEQLDWLDRTLAEAKSNTKIKNAVVFMHIPLFLTDAEEKNQYFSIPMPLRMMLLEKFVDAGVSIIFSGHYHRNAGGVWTKTINGKTMQIESVVTSAIGAQLGKDKSGVSVVQVNENNITQKYYAIDDLPMECLK